MALTSFEPAAYGPAALNNATPPFARAQPLRTLSGGGIVSPVLWAAAQLRTRQWDIRARDSRRIQLDTLLSHVRHAQDTEFGRAHGFSEIRSYGDYKKRVPLRPYAEFEPYLERMRAGARNVLYPGLMPYFGQSSGSSSTEKKNKFLPISMAQIRHQQKAGFDLLARYLVAAKDRDYARGYMLFLFPPGTIKYEGEVGIASNPAVMLNHLPGPSRLMTVPKAPIRDIEDYDTKLTAIAEAYLDYDVRGISGTTCWFSLLFDRVLQVAQSRGRKVSTISEVWPNLNVMFGGGIHAAPYLPVIDERMGKKTYLVDNYNATEGGVFAASDLVEKNAMISLPDRGVFFEFVPREQHGRPDADRIPLSDVEVDKDYSVVLTTASGLFSYYIGDFVRFASVRPHYLQFAGRASGMLSVTQELTSYIEIENACHETVGKVPCRIVDFAASAEVGVDNTAKGRYVLFVEFEKDPANLDSFLHTFDQELCGQNRVYREHRKSDVAILPPRLVHLPKGVTRKFMQAIGQNSLQNKFPRIIDERRRDLLESLAGAA